MAELPNKHVNSIWITWEHQRRSIVLAEEFGAVFYELESNKKGILRYLSLCLQTIKVIKAERPKVLFVQSPSIILSAVAAIYRKIGKRFVLVVDRHSNFFSITKIPLVDYLLQLIADFALRNDDITIVTNNALKDIVEYKGGFSVVLQDKVPNLSYKSIKKLAGTFNLLYPCSFSVDEPIIEVIKSAKLVRNDVHIYITGNYENYAGIKYVDIPENVHLLGFVSDQDYMDYMYSADAVIALTNWESTLLCCAYEGVSLKKPIILSDKKELSDYFYKGRVICDNSPHGIAIAIKDMLTSYTRYAVEISELKKELSSAWVQSFNTVKDTLCEMLAYHTVGGNAGQSSHSSH